MGHPYWPLFDIRIRTPRLEIRLPTEDEFAQIVTLADQGIHDPAMMPFTNSWTDRPVPERHRESYQWFWKMRADWSSEKWTYTGAVFYDDQLIGIQDMFAEEFPKLRSFETGSWLGKAYQGQGFGKEMRAGMLDLGFVGLDAVEARSGAFADNAPSRATSRSLGYLENGFDLKLRRGVPGRIVRLVMDRATWEASRTIDVEVTGLAGCIEMFCGTAEAESGASTEREAR